MQRSLLPFSLLALFAGGAAVCAVQPAETAPKNAPARHADSVPTYNKEIAPIVYSRCSTCHHAGQVAPFPLLTYADMKKRGPQVAAVTKSKYMPPWKAFGDCSFRDNRSLTDAQIATINRWVEGGMPEGKAADLPPAPKFTAGWLLGPPDLVVKMPKAFHVPADGPDIYRNFVLPLNLPNDVWVRAIDFEPGRRTVVHHSLFFYDATGSARKKDGLDGQPGISGGMGAVFGGAGGGRGGLLSLLQKEGGGQKGGSPIGSLGGWAVGAQPVEMPDNLAYYVPKDADLILSTHFHPTGKPEDEQSSVGLYFAKKPPTKQFAGVQMPPFFGVFSGIDIPAGTKNYTIVDSFTLPVDVKAFGVTAHAHYLAHEMTLTATLPDGRKKTLLEIPDWDFNWQDQYVYKQDEPLPKGTVLHTRLIYDNTAQNPRNPSSPPKHVKWGEQTTDEMGSVTLRLVAVNESDLPTLQEAYKAHVREAVMNRPAGAGNRPGGLGNRLGVLGRRLRP
jgi:mono/diheme cytochrome c family protein